MNIGKRIKKIRESREITQEELANKAEVSQPFICAVENDTRNISLNKLKKICNKGLKISLAAFFDKTIPITKKRDLKEMEINKIIENLRDELHLLINKKEEIDDEVVKKSKELDKVLNEYYNNKE